MAGIQCQRELGLPLRFCCCVCVSVSLENLTRLRGVGEFNESVSLKMSYLVCTRCTSPSGRMSLPTPEVLRKSLGSALPWHLTLLVTAEGVGGTQWFFSC